LTTGGSARRAAIRGLYRARSARPGRGGGAPAGSVYTFEVGGAFRRTETGGSSSGLVYYWYIDWALDSPTLMIKDSVTPRLDYRPCSATDDPLPPTQVRPGMRTLVVVASTGELEEPDLAYLGAGEDQAVATYTWTLVFTNECP
jgi:hypothetical protein